MNIVIDEIRVGEDSREYRYIEYDKNLSDGTPYSSKEYLLTEEELNQPQPPTKLELLQEEIDATKGALNFLIMNPF